MTQTSFLNGETTRDKFNLTDAAAFDWIGEARRSRMVGNESGFRWAMKQATDARSRADVLAAELVGSVRIAGR